MHKKLASVAFGIALLVAPLIASAQIAVAPNASLVASLTALVQVLQQEVQQLVAARGGVPTPDGAITVTASTTPVATSTQLYVTINQGSLTSSSTSPIISGTATNISSLRIAVESNSFGGVTSLATTALVTNGIWSATIPGLSQGSYMIDVSDTRTGLLITSGVLTIAIPQASPSGSSRQVPTFSTGAFSPQSYSWSNYALPINNTWNTSTQQGLPPSSGGNGYTLVPPPLWNLPLSGNTTDASGNNTSVTNNGGTFVNDPVHGQVLSLNGSSCIKVNAPLPARDRKSVV